MNIRPALLVLAIAAAATAPSNWELISRAVLARRNKRFAGTKLPPELELTAIAIAKLDQRIGERRRTA